MNIIILRGISGSGKSTVAKQLAQEHAAQGGMATIMSADMYFLKEGQYVFDASKLDRAHGQCLRNFAMTVCDNLNASLVIVDNTNTTAVEVAPYAALALAYGHRLETHTIECDIETAWKRNVHDVPRAVIVKQFRSLHDGTKKLRPEWNNRTVTS